MSFQVSDESFWQRQQKRREKRLGQPCCTQSGISWSMMNLPGRFAVVVHGEKDCLNCFHHHQGSSSHQFYSTRLSDSQLTMGTTEEVLRECIQLIAKEEQPDLILVLGTCPVEVVGANFQETVEDLSQELDLPIVALKTSGLKLSSQSEMLDWLYETLVAFAPSERKMRRVNPDWKKLRLLWRRDFDIEMGEHNSEVSQIVNVFGLPLSRRAELGWILQWIGIELRSFPDDISLQDWMEIPETNGTFFTDISIFPRLLAKLDQYQHPYAEVPVPIGLDNTTQFIRKIAAFCGKEKEAKELIGQIVPLLRQKLALVRERCAQKHFALVLRMRNTVRLDAIAHQGLGLLPFLLELGGDITLYIQGAPDPEVQEAYQRALQEKGIDCPFFIFASPYSLSELLKERECHLVLIPDQGIQAANRAGIAFLDIGVFEPGLSALSRNWERVLGAMR